MTDPRDDAPVAVVGMGYVGLPLAVAFARAGVPVIGIDTDPSKVEALNASRSYIGHIPDATVGELVASGRFRAASDPAAVAEASAVVLCVPTPLSKNREPDISYVTATGKAIAPHLSPGTLVVLESTTYPGTTDEELRPVLEAGSGLVAGEDFFLAYSPEREDPGNPESKVTVIPKVVGGFTGACGDRAATLYSLIVEEVVRVSDCRTAEATKLLENIFRSVNIALVNELKLVYGAMGIDVWEVIAAAKTKPFGYMPFYPGPGLGGHCIPIDPFYLTWKAREFGQPTKFIELAGEVNTGMPAYVVDRTAEALNSVGKPVKGSRVLVIGLAYKPDVDDIRESPAFVILSLLKRRGAELGYYDPHVPVIPPTREHPEWKGLACEEWGEEAIGRYDVGVIVTGHQQVDHGALAEWLPLVVDTRNALQGVNNPTATIWKA